MSEDPIGLVGGVNLYRYVGNGPLTARDPLGLANEGFARQLADMADRSIRRTVRSLERNIQEHLAKLADASQTLASRHHEHELRVLREQLELAEREALRRGIKIGSGILLIILNELLDPAEANAGEEEMLKEMGRARTCP